MKGQQAFAHKHKETYRNNIGFFSFLLCGVYSGMLGVKSWFCTQGSLLTMLGDHRGCSKNITLKRYIHSYVHYNTFENSHNLETIKGEHIKG